MLHQQQWCMHGHGHWWQKCLKIITLMQSLFLYYCEISNHQLVTCNQIKQLAILYSISSIIQWLISTCQSRWLTSRVTVFSAVPLCLVGFWGKLHKTCTSSQPPWWRELSFCHRIYNLSTMHLFNTLAQDINWLYLCTCVWVVLPWLNYKNLLTAGYWWW